MLLRILLLLLTFLPLTLSLQGGVWDHLTGKASHRVAPPTIRVLIMHGVEGAHLQIQGRYSLYDPYTNSHLSSRFAGKSRYIQALGDGLKWGESFPGLYQIKIQPNEESTWMMINGREYRGTLYVYDIGGAISIVNEIPIEEYVSSILLNHTHEHLEPETWAALAIAARTNAYFQAINPKNPYWAVDAQKVGFLGSLPDVPATENASKMTRYMVMSRTGVYEGMATPFAAQFGCLLTGQSPKEIEVSNITLEEANAMAQKGDHAAQILAKAFPRSTIMLIHSPSPKGGAGAHKSEVDQLKP